MSTLEDFANRFISDTTKQLTKRPKKIKKEEQAHIKVHARGCALSA